MKKMNKREKIITVLSIFVVVLIIKGIFDFRELKSVNEIKEQLIAVLQYGGMILMMILPDLLERKFHFHIPDHVYLSVIFFAFLALVCGNGLHFYRIFPWWDTAEHFVSGASLGFIAYWLIDIITSNNAHKHYFINTVLAILIALGCGGVWEMIEYTSDGIQGTNFQRYMKTGRSVLKKGDKPRVGRDALYDTMKDIFVDFGGASVGAVIVYIYKVKTKDAPYRNKLE
jgi:hypothetical protein